jgi:DNA polymerase-3 subunit gamma/tau
MPGADPGAGTAVPPSGDALDWYATVAQLDLAGMVGALAKNLVCVASAPERLHFKLAPSHSALLSDGTRAKLTEALSAVAGAQLRVDIELGETDSETPAQRDARIRAVERKAAQDAVASDPLVQALCQRFDAEVMPDSVEPVSTGTPMSQTAPPND